jgi:hypothetical protein
VALDEATARKLLAEVVRDADTCERLNTFERSFLDTCQRMLDRGQTTLDFTERQQQVFKQIETKIYQ